MKMKNMMFCLVWAVAGGPMILAGSGDAAAADLPRYKFAAGQELVYSASSDFNYGNGGFRNSDDTTLWVTGTNKDGSWHLIYSVKSKNQRTGDFSETNERTNFGSMDIFADGRRAGKPDPLSEGRAPSIFVPLPANQTESKAGWESSENEATQTAYQVKTPAGNSNGQWVLGSTEKGIFHDVYMMTSEKTIYFDGKRGLIERIVSKSGQGYGFKGKGEGMTKLESVSSKGKDWISQLAADEQLLKKAKADADDAVRSVKDGTPQETAKATAQKALESASDRVQNSMVKSELKTALDNLDRQFHYSQEERDRDDQVLNKPAAAWETTDLDGHKHALADYRGKVVALDFWYRGCGWCMRAMPQVKALADEFHGQPVVILGMNTDEKDEDARFVMSKLGLNYTTLHGEGVPQKYGVQGFPTFIIIDQKGIVRARHVGYSPTLREEMAKTINNLLADNR